MIDIDKLTTFIDSQKELPFSWGTHDCCMFPANVVLHMTGKDLAKKFRGKYSTELGAAKALKKHGKGTLTDTICDLLGQPKPPLLAKRGDIVMIDVNGVKAMGVKMTSVVALQEACLTQVDDSYIIACWSVL